MSVANPTRDDFASLLEESFSDGHSGEGQVVKGIITAIEKDMAIIDVGLKVEGRVPLKEFGAKAKDGQLKVGDTVEVYVERIENALGEAMLSREKARREESWVRLEEKFNRGERVEGVIFNQVKGGFTVDLDGAVAFLPRSQVDIRPIRDVTPLMHNPQPFEILKMDRRRGNIVVSRRTVLEESRAEQRSEIVQNLEEGQVVEGVVKNITDYGAFVDLGGIDGLLHVTDMAWRRVNHPTEILNIGQTVKVQIIRINQETHRISLGMKQLESDPWGDIGSQVPDRQEDQGHGHQHHRLRRVRRAGAGHRRPHPRLRNVVDQEERAPRQDPVDHAGSRRAWCSRSIRPSAASRSASSRRSRTRGKPSRATIRSAPRSRARSRTRPSSACSSASTATSTAWCTSPTSTGTVRASRSSRSTTRRDGQGARCSTSTSRRSASRSASSSWPRDAVGEAAASGELRKNAVVTCEVIAIKDGGLEVRLVDHGIETFIKRTDLSRDRDEQRPERFTVGQKVDARVISFDKKTRKLQVSIKALEIAEEKEAVAQYGSTDSGASLGDILGAALKNRGGN